MSPVTSSLSLWFREARGWLASNTAVAAERRDRPKLNIHTPDHRVPWSSSCVLRGGHPGTISPRGEHRDHTTCARLVHRRVRVMWKNNSTSRRLYDRPYCRIVVRAHSQTCRSPPRHLYHQSLIGALSAYFPSVVASFIIVLYSSLRGVPPTDAPLVQATTRQTTTNPMLLMTITIMPS